MKLPLIQIAVFQVKYKDLEKFLIHRFRFEYFDLLEVMGVTNGIHPEIIVSGQVSDGWGCQKQVASIKKGHTVRNLQLMMDILCAEGLIQRGKYIIDTRLPPAAILVYRELLARNGESPLAPACRAFMEANRQDKMFTQYATRLNASLSKASQSSQSQPLQSPTQDASSEAALARAATCKSRH